MRHDSSRNKNPKRVYFAGSVRTGGGYRYDILHNERAMSCGYHTWEVKPCMLVHYGGPFAISCDHGCFHGESTHGCGSILNGCMGGYSSEVDRGLSANHEVNGGMLEGDIVERCLKQIKEADAVHAYIDSHDCYGTLVELGYASAIGKPVYLVFSKELPIDDGFKACDHDDRYNTRRDDLWFLRHMPSVRDCRNEEPSWIHPELLTFDYQVYLKSDHWQQRRLGALEYAQNRCQLCNGNGTLHVHHRTYERLWKEEPADLIVLCKQCHEKHHDITAKGLKP